MTVRTRQLAPALLAAALFAASAATARQLRLASEKPYDVGFVPTAAALRWLSLGHPTLAANLTWLRTVQYMGEPRGDERGWEKLRPLLETVTDLDPRHGYAYQTGANILASAGLVGDSNAILEKGIRNVPDRYILPFQRAVNAFLYAGDYAEAGRWFEVAARTPGAPGRMREYVVAMYVKGDEAGAALSFLRKLEEAAQDDESRKAVQAQIKRAIYERDASLLDAAAEAYRQRRGALPKSLTLLVDEGLLPSLPKDPYGGRFVLGEDGRARSTEFSKRFLRPLTGPEREAALRAPAAAAERRMKGSKR